MHVTGFWSGIGAVITGLILADILYNWRGSNALLSTGGNIAQKESSLLAGRG